MDSKAATGPASNDIAEIQNMSDTSHEEMAEKRDVHADDALKFLYDHRDSVSPEEEKAVLRKIDWRLIPVMMLVNSIQLVDKNVSCFPEI